MEGDDHYHFVGQLTALLICVIICFGKQEGLFHWCGDTLMAVRIGEWKLKYYMEELPTDDYADVC